jgi:hypothetical protein
MPVTLAVLGGGFQGCCVALALSLRGVRVTLFDRGKSLMSRTAVANEGKVHLGYMYAADPSLKTARTMVAGALAFGPFIARVLGRPQSDFVTSQPAAYVVHRESQCTADAAVSHLMKTHQLIAGQSGGSPDDYFGQDLRRPLDIWSPDRIAAEFDPGVALAVVQTPEIAIDPIDVMAQIRARIAQEPLIDVRLGHEIEAVEAGDGNFTVRGSSEGQAFAERFGEVVNALWEGRLAIDSKMGLLPGRPWLHRLKYGITLKGPGPDKAPRSCTVISGPFGEVVHYPDATIYLTWYPHCVTALSSDITPPHWDTHPQSETARGIVRNTVASMAKFIRKLDSISEEHIAGARVKGGPIFAWGRTDIDDPSSELHRRYEIGVYSQGGYHSIDPGKLTMAPFFAEECAGRMVATGRRPASG